MKPKIMVYSASEDTEVALAIQDNLQASADVVVWNQDVFLLSESTVDGLTKHAHSFDFGIFILAPHDAVRIRGSEFAAPRDNVLFELGIFVGHLGKWRSILVIPDQQRQDPSPRIASDLAGWVVCRYDPALKYLDAALGPACKRIRSHVERVGLRYREVHIVNKKSGKCLDVSGGSKEPGTPVIQYQYSGRGHQRWRLRKIDGDYVQIVAYHSGKCLDVRGADPTAGAIVQQHGCHERWNQQWRLEAQDDGAYSIMARHSEKYLTVIGGSDANRAAVIQDDGRDDDSFRWWINPMAGLEEMLPG
jgi:hypothetical protein